MLKFLAVMNSTIRYFCYACNMAVFASADALRRLEHRRKPALLYVRAACRRQPLLLACFHQVVRQSSVTIVDIASKLR